MAFIDETAWRDNRKQDWTEGWHVAKGTGRIRTLGRCSKDTASVYRAHNPTNEQVID